MSEKDQLQKEVEAMAKRLGKQPKELKSATPAKK